MPDPRKPIEPLPPRWKPSTDPANIQISGLDTTASVADQIEQIEQLITIKLQNVDENFSKIHNVLGNRILPAVKKYSVGTASVRDAAKFWTSFYEQAAQIRIPTFEDHSTVNEFSSEQDQEEQQESEQHVDESEPEDSIISSHEANSRDEHSVVEPSLAQTDASFTPSQAVSSTPATGRIHDDMVSFSSRGPEPSWANSMESPLLRLKGEIENFTANESQFTPAPFSRHASSSQVEPTPDRSDTTILPASAKGKGKAKVADPLLRGVLRHNLYSNQFTDEFSTAASPVRPKAKPKTPVIPKTYNPYLPPDTDPDEWNGVVNLSDPSILTPKGYRSGKKPASQRKLKTPARDDSDDSIDLAGMSPPVLMSPARPPRSSAELGLLKVGQSPVKQAAARIKQDLLRDVQANSARKFHSRGNANPIESSMSTVSTPPSLSRYHRADASESVADDSTLENMLRRVGLPTTAIASTPGLRLRSKVVNDDAPRRVSSSPDSGDNLSQNPLFTPGVINEDDGSLDDWDSDSFDDEVNPGIVSARPGAIQEDDAFDSDDSSDSLTDEIVGFVPPPGHPVDDYIEEDSESFDYDNGEAQEETVFGVPPAQRLRAAAAQQQAQAGLRLHGGDLLDDTIGAQAIAGVRNTDESPTPASWGSNAPLR